MPYIRGLYYSDEKIQAAGPDDWREMAAGASKPSSDVRQLVEEYWARRDFDSGIYWLRTSLKLDGHDVPIEQLAWVLTN